MNSLSKSLFAEKYNNVILIHILPIIIINIFCLFLDRKSLAETTIIPSNSLNNEQQTNILDNQNINGNNSTLIQGGALRGSTLFHTFLRFNIGKDKSAYFQSNPNINTIFARVIEGPSFIDGRLGVFGGNSDLFLINSKGIIFGKNSQLDLNGSFTATTANKIIFKNYELVTSESDSIPILTIDKPVGLFFSEASGNIIVRNDGVQIFQPNLNNEPPVLSQPNPLSLSSKPGQNLSFLGKNVIFEGGVVNLYSGRLNIGSIKNGYIEVDDKTGNYNIDSKNILDFGNVSFLNNSFILNTSLGSGSIFIFGNDININNSTISTVNIGNQNFGSVNLFAANNINISGEANPNVPQGYKRSVFGILTTNFGTGKGSDIKLDSANINISDSGVIFSGAYNSGSGGNLFLNVSDSIILNNSISFSTSSGNNGSTIGSATFGVGDSGDLKIISRFLSIRNGSLLSTNTQGIGNAGNVTVKSDYIEIDGFNSSNLIPSTLSSTTGSEGNSGNLTIEANDISIINGGAIGVTTFSTGDAKSVFIDANNITISGSYADSFNGRSGIFSSAANLGNDATFAIFNGANLKLTGNSGDIIIKAKSLKITNKGEVTAKNDGTGTSGRVSINSDYLVLDNGSISIATKGGDSGETTITTTATVLKKSSISASTLGSGNGGIVNINTGAFAADRGSSVLAQAIRGRGGNININAVGIIGSPLVSASSELGVDGTVQIRGDALKRQDIIKTEPGPIVPPFKQKCIPGSEEGRLIGVTRDYINDEVLDNLAARPEQLKFVDDTDGGRIKPLIRERGYVRRSDGRLEFVYLIPADTIISSRQNQNVCTLLESAGG